MRTGRGRTTRAEEGARPGAGWRRGILRDMPFEGTFVRRNVGRNPRSEDTIVRGRMNRGTDFRSIHLTINVRGSFRLKSSAFRLRSPSRTWGSFGSFSFHSCRILFGIRSSSPPHGSFPIEPFILPFCSLRLPFRGSVRLGFVRSGPTDPQVALSADPGTHPGGLSLSSHGSENERDTPGTRSLSNQGGTRDSFGFDGARVRNLGSMEDVGLDGKGRRHGRCPPTKPSTWSQQETWERWEKEG